VALVRAEDLYVLADHVRKATAGDRSDELVDPDYPK
jgi:hypothetical protein